MVTMTPDQRHMSATDIMVTMTAIWRQIKNIREILLT